MNLKLTAIRKTALKISRATSIATVFAIFVRPFPAVQAIQACTHSHCPERIICRLKPAIDASLGLM
jgi:hypothetical protein